MSIRIPQSYENVEPVSQVFPAGLVINLRSEEPDEMSSVAPAWDQVYYQLGTGRFFGSISVVHTTRVQVGIISWEPGIFINGTIAPNVLALALLLRKTRAAAFLSTPLTDGELVVIHPDAEFEFSALGPCKVLVATLDGEMLESALEIRSGESGLPTDPRGRLILKQGLTLAEVGRIWEQQLEDLMCQSQLLAHPSLATRLEQSVLDQLLNTVELPEDVLSRPERVRAAQRAKDLLLAHLSDPLNMSELCKAINANERSLFMGFHEVFGMSPKRYLKQHRLNRARQDFRNGPYTATVTDVALRWGFFHLSRFAADYYQMFGELPRETLRKKPTRR